ncbi:POLO box domain-containing protein OS=Streptomyces microflavus OX=1919 GN=G3I39_23050 PE=4 SV=1 [Streptomyces microflavus]
MTNPDGSVSSLDNGRFVNSFPDGSSHSIDPDTGIATVTDPQGRTETVTLDELNSRGSDNNRPDFLDDLRDLGQNRDLGNLGDLNGNRDLDGLNGNRDLDLDGLKDLANGSSGGGGGGGDGTTRDVSLSELGLGAQVGAGGSGGGLPGANLPSSETLGQVSPLSDSTTNNATVPGGGSGGGPGAPGAPGTPGSPGMPMGGGMGGMGAGGEKGNGERVRAVLVDAAEESERRNRRRRSPWNRQEDSDTFLTPASRVATTGGGDSPAEEQEQGRRPVTSADYLEEDADVWGTEEGGTPAVIGR